MQTPDSLRGGCRIVNKHLLRALKATIPVQVLGCAAYMQSFCFRGLSLLRVNSPVGIQYDMFSLWHQPFAGFAAPRIFMGTILN